MGGRIRVARPTVISSSRCARVLPLLLLSSACQLLTSTAYGENLVEPAEEYVIRARVGADAVLPCLNFADSNTSAADVSWLYGGPTDTRLLGSFNTSSSLAILHSTTAPVNASSSYRRILLAQNGSLILVKVGREFVEKYTCRVEFRRRSGEIEARQSTTKAIHFRLKLSDLWFGSPSSLFWGSCLSSIVFCAASFLLNIVWILVRKLALWVINRQERMSRVRSMVEAIEKYRQRQMESLHDAYHRKINTIRDNYHSQVEQIRVSTHHQMESVTQHIDAIRENYNQQVTRIRDYGSRRAEQLWESYERQLNRVRTFSLQQRLRLQRQYKVKQRYINKLLESLTDTASPEALQKQEAAIRAVLEQDVLVLPLLEPSPLSPNHLAISRASSYYSLPEFIDTEEGEVQRPSPSSHSPIEVFSPSNKPRGQQHKTDL